MADLMSGPAGALTGASAGSGRGAGEGLLPRLPTGGPEGSVAETVRGLELRGLDAPQARNIAALTFGVWPARTGWTVAEVEHLRFLRAIVREGALES